MRLKLQLPLFITILLTGGYAFPDALPSPLTLDDALNAAKNHPVIKMSESRLAMSQADASAVAADSGVNVQAKGYLTWIEPSDISIRRGRNDSKAILSATKRLYDFGYSESRQAAADEMVKSRQLLLVDDSQKHQLNVMEKFFAVLIADKDYVLKNEEMTMAFLDYDKARDRSELGTVSEVDLLEMENGYREKLQLRKLVEQQQRFTRIELASLLNRPDDLPSELVEPEINWQKDLPAISSIVEAVEQNNIALKAAKSALLAAQEHSRAANATGNPVIRGEISVGEYERETASTHKASAGLVIEVPLYTGGRVDAEKAKANAQILEKQAELRNMQLKIRQQAIEQLLLMESLKADLEALQVSEDFGELYLDKNRALYELEVSSDFGDAVVRVSEVILNQLRSKLNYALAEARLLALIGKDSLTEGEGK